MSLIFIPASVGYIAASFLNSFIHITFGRRGAAFLGPGLRLIAYIVISQECPFPGLVICFCVSAFGIALSDAAWNAWIGAMQNSNEVLGILHAFYGLGATLSPLFATTMITKGGLTWYTFYYLMVGLSIAELAAGGTAFWTETGKKYRADNEKTTGKTSGHTREALRNRVTWICCFFLLVYSGTEVALGGWVVQFMRVVRHATPFPAGMSATGYWLGLTVGRVALGFVTPRIGEKLAILVSLHPTAKYPLTSQSPSTIPQTSLTRVPSSDLHRASRGCTSHLLARAQLLCLCGCCRARWLLSRPSLSRLRRRRHKGSPAASARGQHRLFGRVWDDRRGNFAICRRGHCASTRRLCPDAYRAEHAGS